MGKPIYLLFVGNKNIASDLAWKALSETERKTIEDKQQAAVDVVGGTFVVRCDSAWADEMHPWWGVGRFPDLPARIEFIRLNQESGGLAFTDAFTLMGTSDTEPEAVTIPNPLYKLWIIKNNPATVFTRRQPKGVEKLLWDKHAALFKQYASQSILFCRSAWCNEAYEGFGIDVYPDIETHMQVEDELIDLGFPGYYDSVTYLGLPSA
jgi:hypothetical protein